MNTPEKELNYCTTCNQMTNHSGETCLKHTPDTDKEKKPSEIFETYNTSVFKEVTTPDTEWEEGLQDVMERYIMVAEMGHFAVDQKEHKEDMRAHWENLKSYIRSLLISRDTHWKERVRKEVEFARSNYDREGKHALDYILSRLDNLK